MIYKNAEATSAKIKGIQEETGKDSCLMRIARYVTKGWPTKRDQIPADVKPYWSYKEELSMINGILFKGERSQCWNLAHARLPGATEIHFGQAKS